MLKLNPRAIAEMVDADRAVTTPRITIHRAEAWIEDHVVYQEEADDRDELDIFRGRYAEAEKIIGRLTS